MENDTDTTTDRVNRYEPINPDGGRVTNKQLQEFLSKFPGDCYIHIHIRDIHTPVLGAAANLSMTRKFYLDIPTSYIILAGWA